MRHFISRRIDSLCLHCDSCRRPRLRACDQTAGLSVPSYFNAKRWLEHTSAFDHALSPTNNVCRKSCTTATMSTARCYFLELPEELRQTIYAELLKPHTIHIYSADAPSIIGKLRQKVAATWFMQIPVDSQQPQLKLYAAILRICYQVHAEGKQLLYTPNELILYRASDVD